MQKYFKFRDMLNLHSCLVAGLVLLVIALLFYLLSRVAKFYRRERRHRMATFLGLEARLNAMRREYENSMQCPIHPCGVLLPMTPRPTLQDLRAKEAQEAKAAREAKRARKAAKEAAMAAAMEAAVASTAVAVPAAERRVRAKSHRSDSHPKPLLFTPYPSSSKLFPTKYTVPKPTIRKRKMRIVSAKVSSPGPLDSENRPTPRRVRNLSTASVAATLNSYIKGRQLDAQITFVDGSTGTVPPPLPITKPIAAAPQAPSGSNGDLNKKHILYISDSDGNIVYEIPFRQRDYDEAFQAFITQLEADKAKPKAHRRH